MRTLLALLLAAALARAASWKTVNLGGGFQGRRTTDAKNNALLITTRFAVRYQRHAPGSAQRTKADAHAVGVARAFEQTWTRILLKQDFKIRSQSWMEKARIPVIITDIPYLGVASVNNARTNGRIRIDLAKDIKDVDLLYATCAHEFFHLVQYEHALGEDDWVYDGTAVWMEDKVFANRARRKPNSYGALFYRGSWNRTYHYPLPWENHNHAYADAFLVQYLTEQTSNALVRNMWVHMRIRPGDNTGAAINMALGGDNTAWGDAFQRRFKDFAIANLIRDKSRAPNPRYAIKVLSKPLPEVRGRIRRIRKRRFPADGLALFGASGRTLRTRGRSPLIQGMKYDELLLPAAAQSGPVGVVLLIEPREDARSGYAAVIGRPAGKKWSVKQLEPLRAGEWFREEIRLKDPKRERLFLVWSRPPRSIAANRFTALLLAPPVVKHFRILQPALDEPQRELANYDLERQPYDFYRGRAYTDFPVLLHGILWTRKGLQRGDALRLQLETTAPVAAPVKVKLMGSGESVEVALGAVAGKKNLYEGRIPFAGLKPLVEKADGLKVEIRARDGLGRGLDGRPDTPPEVVPGDGKPSYDWVHGWEGERIEGAVLGGTDDLGGRTIPVRREKEIPVEVALVVARRGGEVFYDSLRDKLRPLTPGTLEIEVVFRGAMDRARPAQVKLGPVEAAGAWKHRNVFTAKLRWPEDGPHGWQTLSVSAVSEDGRTLDADPKAEGDQPDTTHKLLSDAPPVFVRSLRVAAGGELYYEAEWKGGPDLSKEPNVSAKALAGRRTRKLAVHRAQTLPASGKQTLAVTVKLSRGVKRPPEVHLGGVALERLASPDGAVWEGAAPLDKVRAAVKEGAVPVEIRSLDEAGRGLDADPRTAAAARPGDPCWEGFESEPGGKDEGRGGPDRWHRIESPPRISYVLILDGSLSMKDQDRLINAKKAIRALLDQLPGDVEMGLAYFTGGKIYDKGFTRDREQVWKWVEPIPPEDGTPLAAAIDRAREILVHRTHPASHVWRYRVFSDGKETWGGDPVAALRRLDAAIARRRGKTPPPQPPRVPPPKKPQPPGIKCNPQQWLKYVVRVEQHRPFDWIHLVEVAFEEKALPDGRFRVRLEERPRGVAYGSVLEAGGKKRIVWRIDSVPGRVTVREASSDQGKAAIEAVRKRAAELAQQTASMTACRKRIDAAVRESLAR